MKSIFWFILGNHLAIEFIVLPVPIPNSEILFSLNELEQCIQVCENVLAASPTEEKALDHIAKCRARLSHPE